MRLTEEATLLAKSIVDLKGNISEQRKGELDFLIDAITNSINKIGKAQVTVICTHNSRRSHIGQIMIKLAALFYDVGDIYTFSGGTEATAMNPRVVTALKEHGIEVRQLSGDPNPKYYIPLVEQDSLLDIHFSKPYHCNYNPQHDYIALMVCNSADQACPIVTGAMSRISLPYIDPKVSDDTPEESKVYYDKVLEIGREMFYVMSRVKNS